VPDPALEAHSVGMVFNAGTALQRDLLLPWRSVLDNVTLGLEVRNTPRREAKDKGRALIAAYGLAGFEDARPRSLSGGMRQRVAFMRTLALDPTVILLDEPFSALDFQTRLLLQNETMAAIRERHKSAILVTHDIGEKLWGGRESGAPSRPQPLRRSARCHS